MSIKLNMGYKPSLSGQCMDPMVRVQAPLCGQGRTKAAPTPIDGKSVG